MKGMILAAGFGTRLNHLTKELPKALVPFKGIPMINLQIKRLMEAGITEIVVNAHHQAEKIEEYFEKNDFGIKVNILKEPGILGTGGAVLNAESHLRGSENFIVINVDVDTDFDLNCIIKFHKENNPLATMAVQKRNAARNLEFDKDMHLIGKEAEGSDKNGLYAFNGIHVISDRIFEKGYEVKFNGILEMYFDLIKNGEYILGCDTGKCWFQDLGKAHIILNS